MMNIYQKIIAIIYLITLIVFSFYSPLYSGGIRFISGDEVYTPKLELGSLWLHDVDWFRFGYIFFFINLLFILLFYLVKNKPNPDVHSKDFKSILKREIIVFLIFISLPLLFLSYMFMADKYHKFKEKDYETEIVKLEIPLDEYNRKFNKRSIVYHLMDNVFDLTEYNDDINRFWEKWHSRLDDEKWVSYIIKTYNNRQKPNEEKFKDITHFRDLFSDYNLTNDQLIDFENIKQKRYKLIAKKVELIFYNSFLGGNFNFYSNGYGYFNNALFIFVAINFCLLYVFRYIFYGVKKFNRYLKE